MNDLITTTTTDLATVGDRQAALERLNEAAEGAVDAVGAREIMLKAKYLADLLEDAKAPFLEAHLAGRATVVSARRLGKILATIDSDPKPRVEEGKRCLGFAPSERRVVAEQLGMKPHLVKAVLRLAKLPDPDFQRYVQDVTLIPSVNDALRRITGVHRGARPAYQPSAWHQRRRRTAGVTTPANPSLDEAYNQIVKALGHLGGAGQPGGSHLSNKGKRALSSAMELLYEAEDLLRPYRGGYVR